jgi:hypothetical protein
MFEIKQDVNLPMDDTGNNSVGSKPITHDKSVELPFIPKDLLQQLFMGRAMCAIDLVVSCHDRPWFTFANGDLEWLQMDFSQRSFRNDFVNHESSRLLVVGGIMLDTCANAFALKAVDVCRG